MEAIRESVLAEIKAIAQSERKASLPSNLNDAIGGIVELEQGNSELKQKLVRIVELEEENRRLRERLV